MPVRKSKKANTAIAHALELLERTAEIRTTEEMSRKLVAHVRLIVEWNHFASLVSRRDRFRLHEHTADSLSLAPYVLEYGGKGSYMLDIGSGGGFPAIPLKIVLPEVTMILIERSAKKVAFLRKVIASLDLQGIQVISANFPQFLPQESIRVLTARAVEEPIRIMKAFNRFLGQDSVFLCQSEAPESLPELGLDVEEVDDLWSREGIRRGSLRIIRQKNGSE